MTVPPYTGSRLEAEWSKLSGVVRAEIEHDLDVTHCLSLYSRCYRIDKPRRVRRVTITDDWVRSNFLSTVEGSLSGSPVAPQALHFDPSNPAEDHDHVAIDWEREMALAARAFFDQTALLGIQSLAEADLEQLLVGLLAHPWIGRQVRLGELPPDFSSKVAAMQAARVPIQIVLPSFPFKDQNPFRTSSHRDRGELRMSCPPTHLDLGEVLMLIRLHLLDLALQDVWHGVDWVLLTDGVFLADIFGVDPHDAIAYREGLRSWRDKLNLQQSIHIVDLQDLVRAAPDYGGTHRAVQKALERVLKDQEVADTFEVLARGIRSNLNLNAEMTRLGQVSLVRALDLEFPENQLDPDERPTRAAIDERAREAALRYAVALLTVRAIDLYNRFFPQALRATVHPKPGQIAISAGPRSDQYPWNGVPLVQPGEASLVARTRVLPAWRVCQTEGIRAAFLPSHDAPFYYETSVGNAPTA